MKTIGIAGVGLVAPGIESWECGRDLLASGGHYEISAEFPVLKPSSLSANEKRRTTDTIKLALQCAQDAMTDQSVVEVSDPELTSVFACSSGDLNIVDSILSALTLPGKPVSPLQHIFITLYTMHRQATGPLLRVHKLRQLALRPVR